MTCKITEDENGNLKFECGPAPRPKDHECDIKGPGVEFDEGRGWSATCSVCGRLAFQEWDIW